MLVGHPVGADPLPYALQWKRLVRGPVALAWQDSVVFVGQADGELTALRQRDGMRLWHARGGGQVRQLLCAAGGLVVFSDAWGQVGALDVHDGATRWRGPPGWGEAELATQDSLLYLGSADGWLYALRLADGTEAWRLRTGIRRPAAPWVQAGGLYAGTARGRLLALDAGSGVHLQSGELGAAVQAGPVSVANMLVAGCEDGYLRAVRTRDLAQLWQRRLGAAVVGRPILLVDRLVVAAGNGYAYGVRPADGEIEWKQALGARPTGPPAAGNGCEVVVATEAGRVAGLDAETGRQLWDLEVLPGSAARVQTRGDWLMASAGDGYLYAFARLPRAVDEAVPEEWWEVLDAGRKIGYTRQWFRAGAGAPVAESGSESVSWSGGFLRTRSQAVADAECRPLQFSRQRIEDSQVLETRGRWESGVVRLEQRLAGRAVQWEIPSEPNLCLLEFALQWLSRQGRPRPGQPDSVRVLDPEGLVPRTLYVSLDSLGHGVRVVRARYGADLDQPLLSQVEAWTWLGPDGEERRSLVPTLGSEQVRADRNQAVSWAPPGPNQPLRLDHPIAAPADLSRMVVRLPDRLGDPGLLLVEEERQILELDSTGQFQIVVRRVPWVGAGRPLPIQDPEVAPFLVPSLYTQADDPRLQALARQLRSRERDSWQVVCHIEEWVHDHMVPRDTNVRFKSALEVLDDLEGTCSEYAALFIALCQAAGVPARACAGFVPAPTGELVLHIWAQVFVGRWVDVDPTWDQLAVDASHLKTSQGRLEPTGMARLNLPVQFMLARADTLELVEYEGDGDRFLGRAESLYTAAQEADRAFQEEQAQELYRRILLLPWNQRSGEAQVEVGRFHLYRRQWPAATAAFEQILERDPDGPAAGQALFYLSRAAEAQGDTLQARDRLGELVRRFPDHELADDALGRLAELHERQEGCARAVPLYERVREEYSRSGWAEVAKAGLERCRNREPQESGNH